VIRNKQRKLVFQGRMKESKIKSLITWQAHGKTNCISISSSLKEIRILASAIIGHQQNLFLFFAATEPSLVRQCCRDERSHMT